MRTGTATSLVDLSSEFRTQLQKPMMLLFVLAFQQHVRIGASTNATALTMVSSIVLLIASYLVAYLSYYVTVSLFSLYI